MTGAKSAASLAAMKRLAVLAAIAAPLILIVTPAAAQEGRLTVERVFSDPSLSGPIARGVSLSPDGELAAFLRSREDDVDVLDLWAAPLDGTEPYRLIDARALVPEAGELSEAERARRERMRISQRGVVEYAWDSQGRYILAPLEGDIFLASRADGSVRRLTETPADEIDAKVSPQGNYVSWVREQNLYIHDLATGRERALTTDGAGTLSWATADFIAQEEMDRDTGYWWSPDERYIAVARVDESTVDIVPRFDIAGGSATMVEQRYPRAGRPNAVVDLYVIEVASGRMTRVDLGQNRDIYLARVNWSKDGRTVYVQRQSRDQRTLDLLAVDAATGRGPVIQSETSPAWVDLTHDFNALSDGSYLWSSVRDGNRHIYHHASDGSVIRQLTSGDWPVRRITAVNEETGQVYFVASPETPIEQHLLVVPLDGSTPARQLTRAGGWWTVDVASDGSGFVGTYSDPNTPPQTALFDNEGTFVRWIEENRLDASHPYHPYLARHVTPRYGTLRSEDGHDMHYALLLPPDFQEGRRYPVILDVYGGPGVQRVTRGWQPVNSRLYLEAGYIVMRMDNRGSSNRSEAFEKALDRRLGTVEVDDQIIALDWLRQQPFVDPERMGATGWSYGGFMTLMLLTDERSGLAAATSGAPPTEWGLYDTHYTERFMGTPEDNVQGYADSDVVARLDRLSGRLLLIHGMADDNVIFANTTRVLEALQVRGVPFDTMLYPGQRHGIRGNERGLHLWRTYLEFFDRNIGEGRR